MYAIDIVCFAGSIQEAKNCCKNIVAWEEKWSMDANFTNSGVMLWLYTEALKAAFDGTEFDTPWGAFPKVSVYIYLGINVSPDLPLFMGSDIVKNASGKSMDVVLHAKLLAVKELKTLSTLKPLLWDKACPLPLKASLIRTFVYSVMTYGGEFIGFNKQLAELM